VADAALFITGHAVSRAWAKWTMTAHFLEKYHSC
jgi:hypothetical protein